MKTGDEICCFMAVPRAVVQRRHAPSRECPYKIVRWTVTGDNVGTLRFYRYRPRYAPLGYQKADTGC